MMGQRAIVCDAVSQNFVHRKDAEGAENKYIYVFRSDTGKHKNHLPLAE